VKRVTISLKTTCGRKYTMPAYLVTPGLAIHNMLDPRTGKPNKREWGLTHIGSGLSVLPPGIASCPSLNQAERLAQLMARELNWEAEATDALFIGTPYECHRAAWRERLVSIREAYEAGLPKGQSPTPEEATMPPKKPQTAETERELTVEERAVADAEAAVQAAKDKLKAARRAAKQATRRPVYELAGQALAEMTTGDPEKRLAELTGRESKTYAKVIRDASAAIRGYLTTKG